MTGIYYNCFEKGMQVASIGKAYRVYHCGYRLPLCLLPLIAYESRMLSRENDFCLSTSSNKKTISLTFQVSFLPFVDILKSWNHFIRL